MGLDFFLMKETKKEEPAYWEGEKKTQVYVAIFLWLIVTFLSHAVSTPMPYLPLYAECSVFVLMKHGLHGTHHWSFSPLQSPVKLSSKLLYTHEKCFFLMLLILYMLQNVTGFQFHLLWIFCIFYTTRETEKMYQYCIFIPQGRLKNVVQTNGPAEGRWQLSTNVMLQM